VDLRGGRIMGKEDEIRKLLAAREETKNTDYKGPKSWGEMTKDEKHGIIKDMLGMANTRDGGMLIFGVQDVDYEFVGVPEEKLGEFDQTSVNNLLENFTEPKHYCRVQITKIGKLWAVVIEVPEFKEEPILCKKDQNSTYKKHELILKRGALYIRNDKAETVEISTVEGVRELLGRAVRKKRDYLLEEITTILEGKPITSTVADEELYGSEIQTARENITNRIGDDFGYWDVCAYPISYIKNRIPDKRRLKELVTKSAVHSRGWSFPVIRDTGASFFDQGWQVYPSEDISRHETRFRVREGFRVYTSGLFVWRGILTAEGKRFQAEIPRKVVIYTDMIYSVTDYLRFLKRYFEDFEPEAGIYIRVGMYTIADRILTDYDARISLHLGSYVSAEDIAFGVAEVNVAELNGSYQDIANKIIRELLLYFNADEITAETIKSWQDKYLSGVY